MTSTQPTPQRLLSVTDDPAAALRYPSGRADRRPAPRRTVCQGAVEVRAHAEWRALRRCMEIHKTACPSGLPDRSRCATRAGSRRPIADCSDLAIVPTSSRIPHAEQEFPAGRSEQSSVWLARWPVGELTLSSGLSPGPVGRADKREPHESPYTAGHPGDRPRGGLPTCLADHGGPISRCADRGPAARDSDCSDLSSRDSLTLRAVQRPGRNNRKVGTIGVVPTSEQRRIGCTV
jgi:hypothetical protein